MLFRRSTENENIYKYLDVTRELKKLWNMRVIVVGALETADETLVKGLGGIEYRRENQNHPNFSMAEISKNTEKSPGKLRMLAVIQTLVQDH